MLSTNILPNGLNLLHERIDTPLVALWIGTRTGTLSDPEEFQGTNHLLEHFCYRGSRSRDLDDIADRFEALGDYHNAGASARVTQYHALVLQEDVPKALALYAGILRPTVTAECLEPEKKVVISEIAKVSDDPNSFFHRQLKSQHCRGQLAARAALGTEETVGRITPEVIMDFHRLWYRPQNMVVACVGGIYETDFLNAVADTLGLWEDTGPAPELPVSMPHIPEDSTVVLERPGLTQALVGVAASFGDLPIEKEIYLRFISTILGRRLHRQLRREGMTYACGVNYGFHGRHYLIQAHSASRKDMTLAMTTRLEDHIEQLATFKKRELDAVKKRIAIATASRAHAPLSRAETAGMAWALNEPYESPESYFKRATAVTADDLAEFLKQHPVHVQTRLTLTGT